MRRASRKRSTGRSADRGPSSPRAPESWIFELERRILLASISGTSYADFNANGARDAGEPALSGWTVFADLNQNLILDAGESAATTNAAGAYSLSVASTGNYLIVAVPRPGWTQTGAPLPAATPDFQTSGSDSPPIAWPAGPVMGPEAVQKIAYRAVPNDPLFGSQWNFRNTGANSGAIAGVVGMDANLIPAWDAGYVGTGVRIAIVDDGVDYVHADMAAGYDAAYSYDFRGNDANPAPGNNDSHGTAVAGLAVARQNNGIGISGAAPSSRWSAIRINADNYTDTMAANALGWQNNNIDVYNSSWGPIDDGQTLEGPGPLTLTALRNAIMNGRNGKGNVFVWSAGNGLTANDNVNYDGYANSRYTIAVTAVDPTGVQSQYAEPGAPILVAAYSNRIDTGSNGWVYSTDRSSTAGYNTAANAAGDYIQYFSGTSAAAPQVTGVVALMLQANPNLTWRDVQAILGYSARRNDVSGGGWVQNGAGRWVSHKYGFGALDASAAVNLAKTWTNLGAEVTETSGTVTDGRTLPDGTGVSLSSSVNLTSLTRIEKVEVVLTATHGSRGQLTVMLTSPDGTQSILAEQHTDGGANYSAWTFTSTHHWDEIARGTWTLTVTDTAGGTVGTFNSWKLNVYGTAVTNAKYVAVTSTSQTITGQDFSYFPPDSAKITASSFAWQSGPQRVVMTFDKDVAGQFTGGTFTFANSTTAQAYPATLSYNAATRTATFTYTGSAGPAAGILPDGNYSFTLSAATFGQAGGPHLDGNGDGLPDDDAVVTFFQLAGDADHDRTVGLNDLLQLANNYGVTSGASAAQGDFDGDSAVGLNDLLILANRYGTSLPAPAEAVASQPVEAPQAAAPAAAEMTPIALASEPLAAAPIAVFEPPIEPTAAPLAAEPIPQTVTPTAPTLMPPVVLEKPKHPRSSQQGVFNTGHTIGRSAAPRSLPRRR